MRKTQERKKLEDLVASVLTAAKFVEGAQAAHERHLPANRNFYATRAECRMLMDDPGCNMHRAEWEFVERVAGVLEAYQQHRL